MLRSLSKRTNLIMMLAGFFLVNKAQAGAISMIAKTIAGTVTGGLVGIGFQTEKFDWENLKNTATSTGYGFSGRNIGLGAGLVLGGLLALAEGNDEEEFSAQDLAVDSIVQEEEYSELEALGYEQEEQERKTQIEEDAEFARQLQALAEKSYSKERYTRPTTVVAPVAPATPVAPAVSRRSISSQHHGGRGQMFK